MIGTRKNLGRGGRNLPTTTLEHATNSTTNTNNSAGVSTTGVLSLSIHEALAFDGTEVALHPDLFSPHALHNEGIEKHQHQYQPNDGKLNASVPLQPFIEPGDLIEIRVWDVIEGGATDLPATSVGNESHAILHNERDAVLQREEVKIEEPSLKNAESTSAGDCNRDSFPLPSPSGKKKQVSHPSTPTNERKQKAEVTIPALPVLESKVQAPTQEVAPSSLASPSIVANASPLPSSLIPPPPPSSPYESPPLTFTTSWEQRRHETILVGPNRQHQPHHGRRPNASTAASNATTTSTTSATSHTNSEDIESSAGLGAANNFTYYQLRTSLVLRVTEASLSAIKETARAQISLVRQVADLFNLSSFDTVTVTKINTAEEEKAVLRSVSADFVVVTIKDQFISRGEMFHFQNSLCGKTVYEGQRMDSRDGVRGIAREIRHMDRTVKLGIITEDTKITFRSRSARIIWLIQMSTEMWDYASPYESAVVGDSPSLSGAGFGQGGASEEFVCQLYFDKFVAFMHRLFQKWKDLEVTHSLTVVFFSRTYHSKDDVNGQRNSGSASSSRGNDAEEPKDDVCSPCVDVDGRLYEDHYKVVVENETRPDWESIVYKIKKEFVIFPREVGWSLSPDRVSLPSTAAQGNLLEAINVTLNMQQLHYMDRDLHRTGNSIVVVSPGNGVFEVDKKLAGITKQRMMDNGIGSDMLSLSLPPLHVAPFFLYKNGGDSGVTNERSHEDWMTPYEVPHWMHLSFEHYSHVEQLESLENMQLEVTEDCDSSWGTTANGFLLPRVDSISHSIDSAGQTLPEYSGGQDDRTTVSSTDNGTTSHQRDLILWRDFEDILVACRPRYPIDLAFGLPSALVNLVTISIDNDRNKSVTGQQLSEVRSVTRLGYEADEAVVSSSPKQGNAFELIQDTKSLSSSANVNTGPENFEKGLAQWGHVNFDLVRRGKLRPLQSKLSSVQSTTCSGSDSGSSPASSFASSCSFILGRSADTGSGHFLGGSSFRKSNSLQIQPSVSLDIPGGPEFVSSSGSAAFGNMVSNLAYSDESMSSTGMEMERGMLSSKALSDTVKAGDQGENLDSAIGELRSMMSRYDASVASFALEKPQSTLRQAISQQGENTLESTKVQEQAPMDSSGIGAALKSFNAAGSPVASHRKATGTQIHLRNGKHHAPSTHTLSGYGSFGRLQSGIRHVVSPRPPFAGTSAQGDPPEQINVRPASAVAARYQNKAKLRQDEEISTSSLSSAPRMKAGQTVSGISSSVEPAVARATRGSSAAVSQLSVQKKRPVSSQATSRPVQQKSTRFLSQDTDSAKSGASRRACTRQKSERRRTTHSKGHGNHHRRKAWVLNPFRQQDEEEMLAKRTHSRRRWSHVFPPGEVEFKRHAGPNWKSLCQPAVLPLTTDFHPSTRELNDDKRFEFKHYPIFLDAVDRSNYMSLKDLLVEMIMQRIIQDYQLVPPHVLRESSRRGDVEWSAQNLSKQTLAPLRNSGFFAKRSMSNSSAASDADGTLQHTLSLGHNVHKLSYNPTSDVIEVVQYHAKFAQNDSSNTYTYRYSLWMPMTQRYQRVPQTFTKFSSEYRWNKLDNLICGDPALTEDTRYRRIEFGIIPDPFTDNTREQEYVQKFRRLLEYISKLLHIEKNEKMGIQEVTTLTPNPPEETSGARRKCHEDVKHFILQLRKGTREKYEWLDLVLDSVFDTKRTYRIGFHWLVASGSKVDAQIQLLQRRCASYGLTLSPFPQYANSNKLYLHPFLAPSTFFLRDKIKGKTVEMALVERFHFVRDGKAWVEPTEIEGAMDLEWPLNRRGKRMGILARQYVYRTPLLFIRVLEDSKGCVALCWMHNRLQIGQNEELKLMARRVVQQLEAYINTTLASGEIVK